ncbi:MAG: RHS repeat-associated core domain-containing protein [Candidatus Omnitrophica bacterium]|nr:RHS repeat-associated core domain-containing protein [Candidatus Omnitrophota bacterium]
MITDGFANKSATYEYDIYGKIKDKTGSFKNEITYTGRWLDEDTGLYFYRARWYDADNGRFISRDPIGIAGGINLYGYVEGNPVRWIDPVGLLRLPSDIYNDAMKDAQSRFPLKDLHNGLGDAYRHCLASCDMARENGQMTSQFLGWANEKKGDWTHNQERGERAMDDFNNEYGRDCAKSSQSKQDCQQKCLKATRSDSLKTYKSGTTRGYWNQ